MSPTIRPILAIDPGDAQSAYVLYDGTVRAHGKAENEAVRRIVLDPLGAFGCEPDELVIEMIASYGMPVGKEVFETCVWVGRFMEAWRYRDSLNGSPDVQRLYRRDVKMHLTGSMRAKDSNIRQALIDKFGPTKERAVGVKASPGPLYGITADRWAALAVAVTYADRHCLPVRP